MLMKGKMFRPTLLLLASEAEGSPEPRATAYAAVLELIHLATLVHDDAVDHSVLRRGMPTINALFTHQVSVIAGDFLYSRAVQELVRLGDMEPLRVLAKASNELTLGEMRQLAALDALAFSEDDYEFLIRAKTAALFSAACEVGALCGAPAYREPLRLYGERLGMAFQVADDLLDYTASEETTGKPTGLDLREHKVTLPLIHALKSLSIPERAPIDELFRTPEPTDNQIARVVDVVREAGGLEYARRRGEEFAAQAEEAISVLPVTAARAALYEAVAYVMARRS
ncbi:MAG: All-trans-nonaprenyl-diphosphate synthase (geranyl-diphosphate specific) [Gemmatimonadaceae bacterium]|nr:All-trans-nonaprenyl-diphosphate synthase (geranyl-diphosphate specific) [Gemmatimonadaceae bacterium]